MGYPTLVDAKNERQFDNGPCTAGKLCHVVLLSVDVFHGSSIMPKQRIGRFGAMTKANSSGPMNVSSFGMYARFGKLK